MALLALRPSVRRAVAVGLASTALVAEALQGRAAVVVRFLAEARLAAVHELAAAPLEVVVVLE